MSSEVVAAAAAFIFFFLSGEISSSSSSSSISFSFFCSIWLVAYATDSNSASDSYGFSSSIFYILILVFKTDYSLYKVGFSLIASSSYFNSSIIFTYNCWTMYE